MRYFLNEGLLDMLLLLSMFRHDSNLHYTLCMAANEFACWRCWLVDYKGMQWHTDAEEYFGDGSNDLDGRDIVAFA